MPELPDIETYLHALRARILDSTLERVRVANPFLLRTVDPPLAAVEERRVLAIFRIGKRVAIELDEELFIVIHLMIAGRFRWEKKGTRVPGKIGLAALDFSTGTLLVTEAGSKRRASLHLLNGRDALRAIDPGGLEVLEAPLEEFRERLTRGNHTLKRVLTDPRLFSGIGNSYSDEILHRAGLSPVKLTSRLSESDIEKLWLATRSTLTEWTEKLMQLTGDGFPAKVTAFRDEMAVHGRFGQPCPTCGSPVQRIVYADNETNYCARCQNGGRILADRALSRLLKSDWPRSLDEAG